MLAGMGGGGVSSGLGASWAGLELSLHMCWSRACMIRGVRASASKPPEVNIVLSVFKLVGFAFASCTTLAHPSTTATSVLE